jgi:hypothetical protein
MVVVKACALLSITAWLTLGLKLRPFPKQRKSQHRIELGLGNVSLIALLLIFSLLVFDVIAMLIPQSVLFAPATQSFVLRHFAQTHHHETDRQLKELQTVIAQQEQLLSRFSQQAQQSRQWFYDVTGSDKIVKQVGALQEILALSHAQRAQIINNSQALSALTQHPLIIQTVNDPQLTDLITQAGEGHMHALWQLHRHPTITALMNDRQLHQQMMAIDLHAILKQYHPKQWENQTVLPIIWYTTTLQSPQQLIQALADTNGWQKSGSTMRWDANTRFAATYAEIHAKPQTVMTLHIKTAVTIHAYVDEKPVTLTGDRQSNTLKLTSQGKPIAVCLLLEMQQSQTQSTCEIQVLSE